MNKITPRLITPINTQSVTPNTKGRTPTDFITLIDKPEPIKNSVIVIPILDSDTIEEVMFVGMFRKVLATIAKMKKRINHGIFTLASFCLKKNVVAIDNGIIQRERVSFTMVATSSALSP